MKRAVEFTRRARRELAAAAEWWLTHRDKAPAAFDDDLWDAIGRVGGRGSTATKAAARAAALHTFGYERKRFGVRRPQPPLSKPRP